MLFFKQSTKFFQQFIGRKLWCISESGLNPTIPKIRIQILDVFETCSNLFIILVRSMQGWKKSSPFCRIRIRNSCLKRLNSELKKYAFYLIILTIVLVFRRRTTFLKSFLQRTRLFIIYISYFARSKPHFKIVFVHEYCNGPK